MNSVVLDGTAGRDERTDGAAAARSISVGKPAAPSPAADVPMPVLVRVEAAVAHPGWTAARRAVLEALQTTPCVVVLVGARGGGKTLLLAELARALTAAGTPPAQHRWGDPDSEQALEDGPIPPDRLVLIDEADRIDEEALGRLIAQKRYGLVLARCRDLPAGVLELAGTLERRVTVVPLTPLAPGETAVFLADRLVRAGRPADLIGPEAVARIEAWSGGVPRLVNMLATAALFLATRERATVTTAHVDEAVEMFDLHAAESAGTATDPAGLRSPESVPVAKSALEPGPVLEGAGSSGDRGVGIAGTLSETERLSGVGVQQPAAAVAVLERPLPVLQARHALAVRSRTAVRERRLRRVAAAAVLLVGAGAAATTWYAARLPKRAEIASAATAAPALELLAPTPAASMRAEAAAVSPQPATSPATLREASAALPETLPAGPNATLTTPSFDRAPAVETAPPVAVPSPVPERAISVASAELPNGPPLAAVPQPPRPTTTAPARAAASAPELAPAVETAPPVAVPSPLPERAISVASAELPNGPPPAAVPQPPRPTTAAPARAATSIPERVASLTLHSERALEPIIRPPAAPPRSAHVPARAAAPARSPQTAEPTSSGRDGMVVAFLEPRVAASPTPRGPRSPVQQLVQARRALAANDAFAARELLEYAETVIAFQAGVVPERASLAAAQISDALALLNAGQARSALPHLERAIAVIGPSS